MGDGVPFVKSYAIETSAQLSEVWKTHAPILGGPQGRQASSP